MKARIKDKQEVAKGTLFVTFDLLGEEVDFKPGQYVFVTPPDVGYQDDKGLRRHISVVTSPNERGVLGLATRIRDSAFKQTLRELPVGAEVEVEQPKGDFALPEEQDRPLVFVAGGIGITVFRSMLLYIREQNLAHRVTLVYSNRDRESTAFLDELQQLEQQIRDFRLILTMTDDPDWEDETRREWSTLSSSRTSSARISTDTRFSSPAHRR
jgi:ferredoxin-NADP reductase